MEGWNKERGVRGVGGRRRRWRRKAWKTRICGFMFVSVLLEHIGWQGRGVGGWRRTAEGRATEGRANRRRTSGKRSAERGEVGQG